MEFSRITRSDVREAVIRGYERVRSEPGHLRLTPGQRRHITEFRK